jgi:DNA (cytosine-5)-methyltransferase 1
LRTYKVLAELRGLGYEPDWRVLNACDFGVPQLRPRFILVAMKPVEWPGRDRDTTDCW